MFEGINEDHIPASTHNISPGTYIEFGLCGYFNSHLIVKKKIKYWGFNLKSNYPTDKGSFDNKVTDGIKRSILLFGPCRSNIEFPGTNRRGTIRRFSSNYYFS